MAPKKMPKPKPTTDPVDRLLQERELDYQGAMGITNNDLRAREAELLQIQKAYADSGLKVEGFEDFLKNKHSNQRSQQPIIIGITGHIQKSFQQEGLDAGMD